MPEGTCGLAQVYAVQVSSGLVLGLGPYMVPDSTRWNPDLLYTDAMAVNDYSTHNAFGIVIQPRSLLSWNTKKKAICQPNPEGGIKVGRLQKMRNDSLHAKS